METKQTAMVNRELTKEVLVSILLYDKETGVFYWKISPTTNIKPLSIAGCLNNEGYTVIGYNGGQYRANRLAWVYCFGVSPDGEIDHINGVRNDNRISNLRILTHRENCQNRKEHRRGHLVGSFFDKRNNKYRSKIKVNGKIISLGTYDTEQEAHLVYMKYVDELKKEKQVIYGATT